MYTGAMYEISCIRVFEDAAFQRAMARSSAAVMLAGTAAALAAGAALALMAPGAADLWIADAARGRFDGGSLAAWLLALGALSIAALPVHELVHGVCFKLLAPAGARIAFGADWKRGMLFACADGVVFTRRAYLTALAAPAVVLTAAFLVAGTCLRYPVLGIALAFVHLAGCTGDLLYVARIVRDKRVTHCEDTSWGVRLWGTGPRPREVSGGFRELTEGERCS